MKNISGVLSVIGWELRQRRKAIFWWSVGSITLTVIIMALFPSIQNQAAQLDKVLNQLPEGIRGLKTGGVATINIANPVDFLNGEVFYSTLPIAWIILAITRGSSILGKDEQSRTLELLLARPISRGRLLLGKALALFLEFSVVAATTLAAIVISAPLFSLHVSTGRLAMATAYTAIFSLSFGLIAFALQAASTKTRHVATAVAVIISFGGYLLASLSGLTDWLRLPSKFAPFHYFNPEAILHGQAVIGLNVYLLGTVILCAAVSYFGFRRRDIS